MKMKTLNIYYANEWMNKMNNNNKKQQQQRQQQQQQHIQIEMCAHCRRLILLRIFVWSLYTLVWAEHCLVRFVVRELHLDTL